MPAVAAKQSPAVSRLASVQKGRIKSALRYVFYGDNGVGKSTLASHAPKPIWLDIEDGSVRLDVDRYSFRDGPGGHVPHGYADVLAALDDLTNSQHGYQTVVIDTLDRLESLIWNFMIERDAPKSKIPLTSVESYGYGKGFLLALDEWRRFCLGLDRLRSARGMSVVLLAHSQIRTFKNPTDEDYDRYQLRVNDKAAGFLKEWADVVGFVAFEEGATKMDGERSRGWTTGKRLVHFERTAAYDAKTRIVLPPQIELDSTDPWEPLAKAVDDGVSLTAPNIMALIVAEVDRICDPDLGAKVTEATKKANGDVEALSRFLNILKSRPSKAA